MWFPKKDQEDFENNEYHAGAAIPLPIAEIACSKYKCHACVTNGKRNKIIEARIVPPTLNHSSSRSPLILSVIRPSGNSINDRTSRNIAVLVATISMLFPSSLSAMNNGKIGLIRFTPDQTTKSLMMSALMTGLMAYSLREIIFSWPFIIVLQFEFIFSTIA